MKKSALFYIFIFICFILPAAITSYGCRSSLFQSEINPAEEPPRIYDKSELIIKPNIASDINVSSNIQLKIPAGSVSQAARISISTAPPPFSDNGSLSYRGDVFTIDNVNSLKYASISFKIPDDKIGEIESLKILYFLSSDESAGFITPEFINGKAAVSLKNNFSAGETIINASPLPYISRRPEITFNASEFERTELMVSLVSIDIKAKFKTAGFNFYTDNAAIGENEMAHIAAELNRAAVAAAGAGFKTPSTAANNIDVYIMRFVNAAGNPLNEIIGLPRRAGNFARKYDIFLSSSPYDWNRIKNYNLASREYFHLCINEYYGAEKSPAELSKTGWEWFNEAAAAWFCASTLSNPFSMDEIYNSKTLNSLISDSNGLFTRKGGAGERWYFLWLLSNKYGSGKIAEMLNETASSRTFEDFARSNLKSGDFREYLDALMARSYDNIIEKAPQMSLPFTMRLKPLEAAAFKFNIEPGVNVSVKLSQDAAVKIYARLRSALSASRAASKNIIIKNSTYCELISPELIDSNIFDKFYIVSINADLSAATSSSDKEIAVFSPQGANPYNSYIYPLSVTFDKNPDKTADVNLNVKFDALASISNGAYVLSAVKDYAAFETALYIKKEYLCALKTGIYNLAFTFKDGKTAALALTIIDTTPYKPPVRPVSLSLEPGLLILAHASQYDLNLIKITVKYEDGSVKYPDSGIAWKVSQGGGTILENIYRPVNEDFEQLQYGYTLEGFEPVYNYLTVSYSDTGAASRKPAIPIKKAEYINWCLKSKIRIIIII
ncbi:MAG TPA: X2-like carbohydrate binding domain-containing protein [Candidatus Wallbacteria bacterium]|nr:X2-like carbohydrate binding domain-containing protein [Candidatus Wallbacteria bacterium]